MPDAALVEGEPDLERAVRKLPAADDVCQAERVAPTRLWTVFRNVDPATAKQIADKCGGTSALRLLRSTWCRRSRDRSGAVGERADRVLPPVGRMVHTEQLPNDATGFCELLHAPGAVGQALAVHENALPLVQHTCRWTIADPAGLAFAEHPICDADVLVRGILPAGSRRRLPLCLA